MLLNLFTQNYVTLAFREEARDIVRRSCNAGEDDDAVIFTGSGSTGAINKLVQMIKCEESPIVFVSPHEHHSNILPWRELGAEENIF